LARFGTGSYVEALTYIFSSIVFFGPMAVMDKENKIFPQSVAEKTAVKIVVATFL